VPLGVTVVDRDFVPDEGEQATVARIRELHGEALSLRDIAATLTGEGRSTKRGGAWHASTVARVLARQEGPASSWVRRTPSACAEDALLAASQAMAAP
jgi:Recombinase